MKFTAMIFAEPLSHLVSEDVTLTCVASRVGNFPARACWCSTIFATSFVGFRVDSEASKFFCILTYSWTRLVKILKSRSSSLSRGDGAWPQSGTTKAKRESHRRRRVTRIRCFIYPPGRKVELRDCRTPGSGWRAFTMAYAVSGLMDECAGKIATGFTFMITARAPYPPPRTSPSHKIPVGQFGAHFLYRDGNSRVDSMLLIGLVKIALTC